MRFEHRLQLGHAGLIDLNDPAPWLRVNRRLIAKQSRMQFATRIADVTDPDLIRKILDHINSRAPPRLPPRRAEAHQTSTDLVTLLTMSITDTVITTWDSKYSFEPWRPITAIRLANTDGNAVTAEQANWLPLLVTPPYPEYLSGVHGFAGASSVVLTHFFGTTPFECFSKDLPGVTRPWPSRSLRKF